MRKVKRFRQLVPSPQLVNFNRACFGQLGLRQGQGWAPAWCCPNIMVTRPSHQLPCNAYLT